MAVRIEVGYREGIRDPKGERTAREARDLAGLPVKSVSTVMVYTLDMDLSPETLQKVASEPFSDPIIQEYSIASPLRTDFDVLIEVGYKPGVTDNVGRSAGETVSQILGRPLEGDEAVYTSVQYLVEGGLSEDEAVRLASGVLGNGLIQRWRIVFPRQFDIEKGLGPDIPRVSISGGGNVAEIDLDRGDEELMRISRDGLLALSLPEMRVIRGYFLREDVRDVRRKKGLGERVTDVEMEALAQTWSEHCKHKIFNARINYTGPDGEVLTVDSLFKSYIVRATEEVRARMGDGDICLSVFKDNAGVIRFNDKYNLVFKVETHNSPSALDPYGGALTGIVGVNRDPFGTGLGSNLLFNTDVFCFATPFYSDPLPPRILHPRRIYDGVVEGVEHGGNKSGIPTVNGAVVFDDRFLGKPLVYCGTGGIMPREINGRPSHEKGALVGDRVVMVGGRIGKDGIHGATFSSEELHEGSPVSAVQIGDPITQKRMTDFLLRARDEGLYNSITDNGAGGLSSSVGEMAEDTDGVVLHLDRAPLKYAGLDPWEILISEAQERMTVAVPPDKVARFFDLSERMGVESSDLGEFTDTGYLHLLFEGRTVGYLEMEFLHRGNPQMTLEAVWDPPAVSEPSCDRPTDPGEILLSLMSRLNICSKESIVRRYDHEVQGGSVVKPFTGAKDDGPSDAAVIRPILDSFEGVVVSNGIIPRYSDIDTYHMAACAVDEAVRNYVAVGGDPSFSAALDNFCWCDPVRSDKTPDGAYKLAQLVRANQGLFDAVTAYGIPLISGKDSMKNDYIMGDIKISIPPTLLISIIGRMDDVRRAVTMDLKEEGNHLYLLGETLDECGGSEYYAHLGYLGANVPRVRFDDAWSRYVHFHRALMSGLVRSCHDCSDGGLGAALAEMALAGRVGLRVDLDLLTDGGGLPVDKALFSESASRLLVEVHPDRAHEFEMAMENTACAKIGECTGDRRLLIRDHGKVVVSLGIEEIGDAWQSPLGGL
ncbi:MAG: phosphoribosylformylglycinamidine synthase [Deltaproteobacteria bacterium]|nr:phosphoribosylformylglycinamidine synthase [Deltaproteobacteria bacterium]